MSDFKLKYFQKFTRYSKQTIDNPKEATNIIVVIPCLNEPKILTTLQSIWDGQRPENPAEVLIAVNHALDAPSEVKAYNAETFRVLKDWAADHYDSKLQFIPLWFGDLKPKLAGVGTARKVGMDEAVYRFYQIDQPKGTIACLDADCLVANNYLPAIEKHFKEHPKASGASLAFEHPIYHYHHEAIVDFELYLRYYKNALHWAGFPYAYHTIGSAMVVPCDTYQKVGGMNKQKAGEDFYFIEKLVYQGNFTEINNTTVYPSPRQSLRVPFGTGQAVADYIAEDLKALPVFHPRSFQDLKVFINQIPELYTKGMEDNRILPLSIYHFLQKHNWLYYLQECRTYAQSQMNFLKRFFHWFDAFKALQFLHEARDYYHSNIPVSKAVNWLYHAKLEPAPIPEDRVAMLEHWREYDRKGTPDTNPAIPF